MPSFVGEPHSSAWAEAGPHLTSVLAWDPASPGKDRPPTDSMPAAGRAQALSQVTAGDQWASGLGLLTHHSAGCLPEGWAGQLAPPWLLFTVLSAPPWGLGNTLQLLHPMDRFHPGPSLFSVGGGRVEGWSHGCFCLSPGPLGSLLAQGPRQVDFSLKYRGYCLLPVKLNSPVSPLPLLLLLDDCKGRHCPQGARPSQETHGRLADLALPTWPSVS